MCFVAFILRSEIYEACKKFGYDANQMQCEIDRTDRVLMIDNLYALVNNPSKRQCELLQWVNIQTECFKSLVDDAKPDTQDSIE